MLGVQLRMGPGEQMQFQYSHSLWEDSKIR